MAAKKRKACDCVANINRLIADRGIEVDAALNFRTGATIALVVTKRLAGKRVKSPPVVYATYCPFCGKAYETKGDDISIRT